MAPAPPGDMRNKTATRQRETGSRPEGQQLALDFTRERERTDAEERAYWARYWAAIVWRGRRW